MRPSHFQGPRRLPKKSRDKGDVPTLERLI